jgi:polyribonucleotide nucleotidyltransferase
LRDSVKATQRAAQMAREIAIQTNAAIVINQDGKMKIISADERRKQKEAMNPAQG